MAVCSSVSILSDVVRAALFRNPQPRRSAAIKVFLAAVQLDDAVDDFLPRRPSCALDG